MSISWPLNCLWLAKCAAAWVRTCSCVARFAGELDALRFGAAFFVAFLVAFFFVLRAAI